MIQRLSVRTVTSQLRVMMALENRQRRSPFFLDAGKHGRPRNNRACLAIDAEGQHDHERHQRGRILEGSLSAFFCAEWYVLAVTASKLPRLLTRCLPGQKGASAKNRDVPDFVGAPDTIRTCDLCLRRATLYPAELRVREGSFSRLA
jgi:hypothetical protein